MDKRAGRYIVVEGNDGTGKSTQVALLADEYLRGGYEVCIVEEPGSDDPEKSTPAANELRRLIKNGDLERAPEINLGLFSAARGEIWREKIKPALDRGAIVLSARNYYSSLAYPGRGEGMDEAEIIRMTRLFTDEHYMQPDVAVILTLSDAARAERIAMRGELKNPDTFESRGDDFQTRVNQAYIDIARQYNIPTIDAGGTVEEVRVAIWEYVARPAA